MSHMGGLSRAAALAGVAALLLAAGCAVQPPRPPEPAPAPTAISPPPATTPETPETPATPAAPLLRPRARWVPVDWSALPGLADDQPTALWPALRAGCAKPAPGWAEVCARALAFNPPDETFAWQFLQRELQPYRLEALDGSADGLATGYFEPLVAASRQPQPGFTVPLHRPPADLATRKPWYSRQQIDTLPAAQAALRGNAIAWVASPLDALLLQIQGSGRLRVTEPDGRVQTVRLAFAGHNDQPYKSVGRWLIEQGELKPESASWPAIRQWGQQAGATRLQQMLWANPRVVFFREEPLPDERIGPRGAQGVPLTAGRSVAVDPMAVPYGTPLWISTTEPLSATPLRRLVMAQDTGSAITGAVRIDYFWGPGELAEQQAGRMKQPLQAWALWPRQPDGR
ncbi:MAG TPA: MltA domain-containing protein [Aquabacterium sp.]|nr:MltA domain-containing protein [Aquabacterium sp.]